MVISIINGQNRLQILCRVTDRCRKRCARDWPSLVSRDCVDALHILALPLTTKDMGGLMKSPSMRCSFAAMPIGHDPSFGSADTA